jgi:hypothetical protein
MCVIASIRHAVGLAHPDKRIEKIQGVTDHMRIFKDEVKYTEPLALDDATIQRLGDYYKTDLSICGKYTHLFTNSHNRVTTLYYEHNHVWLVIGNDNGYCRICEKQYTCSKWLAHHRRTCHRCPLCYVCHSAEIDCDMCTDCKIYHPVDWMCNDNRARRVHDSNKEEKELKVNFKTAWLKNPNEQSKNIICYDIETVQYSSMNEQCAVNVEWSVRVSPEDVSPDDIVFFEDDQELYTVNADKTTCRGLYEFHLSRAIEGTMWRLHSSFGRENSMREFIEFLNESKKAYVLNAYNGSRFDHLFVLREWQKQNLNVAYLAFQGNSPIMGTLATSRKVQHKFWDVSRHLGGSLDNASRAAGLVINKGSFNDFHLLTSDSAVETHRARLQKYCRIDVQVLTLLTETSIRTVYQNFGVHLQDFLTTSHLSFHLAVLGSPTLAVEKKRRQYLSKKRKKNLTVIDAYLANVKLAGEWPPLEDVYVEVNPEVEKILRMQVYGGRTTVNQQLFESPDRHLPYAEIKTYLRYVDANSLYPYAMCKDMPYGKKCSWDPDTPVPAHIGCYRISYVPNKKLMTPVLPRRDEKGGLVWSLEDGTGWYNTQDISNALKFGYTVTYHEGFYWEQKAPLFKAFINYLYRAKDAEKQKKYHPDGGFNGTLYAQYKLLLNGLYGKTIQRPIVRETENIRDMDVLNTFMENHANLDFMDVSTEFDMLNMWVQGDVSDASKKITKPVIFGSLVLAYSRTRMLELMDLLNPGLTEMDYLYTDTDSLIIKVTPANESLVNSMIGNDMGACSDEMCNPKTGGKNGKIIEATFLAPKAYTVKSILDNGEIMETTHAKGIHNSFIDTHGAAIAGGFQQLVRKRYDESVECDPMIFEWGVNRNDDEMEDEDSVKYSSRPYMVRNRWDFTVKHSKMRRQIRKQYEGRMFFAADEMSYPIGYELD